MHCQNCGAEINRGAHFCGNCGASVRDEPAPPSRPMSERMRDVVGRTRRERMLAAGTVAALVIAIVAFFLLDTPDDETATNDAFVTQADAQCVNAKNVIASISGDAGASPRAAREDYVSSLLVATLDWRIALEKLAVQEGATAEAEPLVDALRALSFDLGLLARVSREGSAADVASASADADADTAGVETAIADAGLSECAALSLGQGADQPA